LAHLRGLQSFTVDRYGTASVPDAIKIASLYRLFGHEVTLSHEKSGEIFPVYANVSDSVVASYELLARTRPFDMIRVSESASRSGRHDLIPSSGSLFQYGECHVTIEMPRIDISSWKCRSGVFRPTTIISSRRKAVEFKVSNMTEFTQTKFVVKSKANVMRQDFYDEQVQPTPAVPVATGVAVNIQEAATMEQLAPVEGVE